jgi:hypothetical protein
VRDRHVPADGRPTSANPRDLDLALLRATVAATTTMADWQELVDEGSGKTYYFSPSTNVTQ